MYKEVLEDFLLENPEYRQIREVDLIKNKIEISVYKGSRLVACSGLNSSVPISAGTLEKYIEGVYKSVVHKLLRKG